MITLIATTLMVLVNSHRFSDDELSAIRQLRSEGMSEAEVEVLLKEYEAQEWADYDAITLTEEPSKRGGPTRRRPGPRGRRQTLLQFLMRKLLTRRRRRPRPRPQHRPQHRPRPSYHKPKPSYPPSAGYDISQIPLKPFDEFTAPVAPSTSTSTSTYQPASQPAYQHTTTESVPLDVYEPVSTTASYTTAPSPSPAPSYYENSITAQTSPSSPTSNQNYEEKTKFRFPKFPFASLERDTFFDNFKSRFDLIHMQLLFFRFYF